MSTYWSTQADLVILKDTYRPPFGAPRIIEIPILASTSSGYPVASIWQSAGRGSKRISFTAHVSTWGGYDAMHDDWVASEPREWVGPESTNGGLWCIIEKLGAPEWTPFDDIRFSCTLAEISTAGVTT